MKQGTQRNRKRRAHPDRSSREGLAKMKQQKPAVPTERDRRARVLRAMVLQVAHELDNHELACLSNAHADLLVEFVERVCDRLGGTPTAIPKVQP